MEDKEKKRAKKRSAVCIMSPEDQHPSIMENFRKNLGEPNRMISMKISVYAVVFGDTAGGRLLRLNNVEWKRGEKLMMQMIPARMSLDSIVQYVSVELKLDSEKPRLTLRSVAAMGIVSATTIAIIAPSKKIQPSAETEFTIQGRTMEKCRLAGST